MGPLSYIIAIACVAIAVYFWYTNSKSQSQVKDSSGIKPPPTKSSQKFLDFDEDCVIRRLKPSDLDTVKALVKGEGGCNYFLDHSLLPFLSESSTECLGFGVEHKKSKKIICTQFIMMVDHNETGIVLGAMIDMKHKSDARIIYMRLSNDVQAQLSVMFDHLGKHRCIEISDNLSYLNSSGLDWKIKFNLDAMGDENVYYLLNDTTSDTEDGVKVNGDFKECEDVDKVVHLLSNKFKISDVLLDSKMYQSKYIGSALQKEVDAKRLVMMVNHEEMCLCLLYGNEDYYVYGISSEDVLSGVRYAKSRTSDDHLAGIFVSKAKTDNNEQLKAIFAKAMENPIVALDYDMHIDGH
eukprot:209559_1